MLELWLSAYCCKIFHMPVIEKLISLIAPHTCIGCGVEGDVVCAWCLPDEAPLLPDRCYRCHAISKASRVCKSCSSSSRLRSAWVRTEYGGLAKQLIHDYKFARKRAAFLPIVTLIDEILPVLPGDTIISYVPTATSRERQRGYDQSRLIAKQLALNRGYRFDSLLTRHGQTRQECSNEADCRQRACCRQINSYSR